MVTVSGNPVLSGALTGASALAAFTFARSANSAVDVIAACFFAALGLVWLAVLLDAQQPRLVLDAQGVRIRFVRTWIGLVWDDFGELSLSEPDRWWQEPVIRPAAADPLDAIGALPGLLPRLYARLHRRCYGTAFAVPLGWIAQVRGVTPGEDLLEAVHALRHRAPAPSGEPQTDVLTAVIATTPSRSGDGPELGARLARARLESALSIQQVSARAKVPASVIRAIESDDFSLCGGHFYARGQVRTLGRVLGVDPAELVASYDATRVAQAEVAEAPPMPEPDSRRMTIAVAIAVFVTMAWASTHLLGESPAVIGAPSPTTEGAYSSGHD